MMPLVVMKKDNQRLNLSKKKKKPVDELQEG